MTAGAGGWSLLGARNSGADADELASTRQALEAERQRYQELFDSAPVPYAEAAAVQLRQLARRSGRPLAEVAASLLRRLEPGPR